MLMANKKSDVSTLLSALTTQVAQNTLTTIRNICCDNFQLCPSLVLGTGLHMIQNNYTDTMVTMATMCHGILPT